MLQSAVLIALAATAGFPQTPADAARDFIGNGAAKITHVVQDGRLAVVTFRNADIEGQRQDGQLLIKHFSFGWQPIDGAFQSAFARCVLISNGASAAQADRLGWNGNLPREAHPECGEDRSDRGSPGDVIAVRAQMQRSHGRNIIGPVRISHNFALAAWAIPGGGETLLTRANQSWKIVISGGGALSRSDLTKNYRVPLTDAEALVPLEMP